MQATSDSTQSPVKTKVWDLPTRVFHWGMLALLVALYWAASEGEMEWHQICAYGLMILLAFRIVWGFIGSETAQFKHFVHSPKAVISYAQQVKSKQAPMAVGHNPLGGYMVVVLISVVAIQLISGLFATDDIFTEGPLYAYVSSEVSSWLTWLHKKNFDLILVLSGVHVLAVLLHRLKGEKLVLAMITGYKRLDNHVELSFRSVVLALILLAALALPITAWLIMPVWQQLI
ncbi:cytochrome b/b6 domain-containing protein [Shewanella waksmanii]|uniref:cytochrome b/b6 domain-containing protein n=1 Tax=Shewanella waksmanii TaxID=213783 RepID=UPI0004904312|nr:cytochrome b/b6 domain-containing protein [Shewanella waksmanii]